MPNMKDFPTGVKWYTSGIAHVPVYFPEGVVRCQYCPFCRSEKELERWWCRLNNEMLYDPFTGIGTNCPIEFDDGKTGYKQGMKQIVLCHRIIENGGNLWVYQF